MAALPPVEAAPDTAPVSPASVGRSSSDVAVESVLGVWQVSSAGGPCQLGITQTGWNGGYRAWTRNCTQPELQSVNAWNLEDGQVVLKDGSGSPVARLAAQSGSSMAGATNGGAAVSASKG